MQQVTIFRDKSSDLGTPGILSAGGGGFKCYTLELPWRDNVSQVSCIPAGTYRVVWSLSPRLKRYTYEILHVTGRGGIRVHGGNFAGNVSRGYDSHSLGCPLLGGARGQLQNSQKVMQQGLLLSQPTLRKFQEYMKQESFELIVARAAPNL